MTIVGAALHTDVTWLLTREIGKRATESKSQLNSIKFC